MELRARRPGGERVRGWRLWRLPASGGSPREILIAAAKAQDSVLAIPAPLVLFSAFGDWALKFELVCYVDDIVMAERVRSEMNFDILRRMREAGLRIPYPK